MAVFSKSSRDAIYLHMVNETFLMSAVSDGETVIFDLIPLEDNRN